MSASSYLPEVPVHQYAGLPPFRPARAEVACCAHAGGAQLCDHRSHLCCAAGLRQRCQLLRCLADSGEGLALGRGEILVHLVFTAHRDQIA